MEDIVYEPTLPFHVQIGFSVWRDSPLEGWGFDSRHMTYQQARRRADELAEANRFVRVVKVT